MKLTKTQTQKKTDAHKSEEPKRDKIKVDVASCSCGWIKSGGLDVYGAAIAHETLHRYRRA